MNQEPLPQIHLIRDTDLSVFAYELHIFAGDFLRECEFNMRSLATNTGADSIAIMGKNHMWLSDALFAYCSTADLHQMILTTEFIGARAFLFHTDRSEGGHLYGFLMPRIKLRNGSTTIPRCSDSGWIRHFVICPRI